ncbi:metalloendopeptidase OMA1, mitochondrial [Rhipicephalus sanguineus]|uniref:metalloendopeptidase OMA1, mitochondrial n=1 Tax=Rhipicephalus sanguineus TaxID=34632 RepID=UPI001895A6A2|nr:metalloendopeptidase OMA1, mitochondrial [Rhipicephalus sanguineus]
MWAARTLLCTARLAASAPPRKAAICWQPLQRQQMTRTVNFHTSPQRCIHPIFLIAAKQITKGLAIITGRGFRKWWKALPADKKAYFISVAVKNKWKIAGYFGVAWGIGGIYYFSHIQETPITHRRRFVAFTRDQFRKISDFEFEMQYELFKPHLLPAVHPVYHRVVRVANQLLHGNKDIPEIHDVTWSVSVIDSPMKNAFVMPNGQIFVFAGMLEICGNDEQLGNVLAHEMAHCVLGHGAEQVSYAHLIDFALVGFLAAIWAIMPTDGIAVVTHWFFEKVVSLLLRLPYSRKLELEADEVGLQLAAKACFDVREASAFWTKMSLMGNALDDVEFISTHPSHEHRSEHLDNLMNKAIELRRQCHCPRLPPQDPRVLMSMLKEEVKQESLGKQGIVVLQPPL